MNAYLYNIKINIQLSLTYRFEVVSGILSQFVLVLANAFLWQAAYGASEEIGGVTRGQMLVYSVVSVLMSCFFINTVEKKIRNGIREGNIALCFIKPVNVFGMYLSEDIGAAMSAMLLKFVPILLFSCVFVAVPLPYSPIHFLLFLLGCAMSFLILWLFGAIIGLLYFWVIDLGPLGNVKDMIILFLSGSFVPIWFFPAGIRDVLGFLPFVYIYQFPIGIFIGKTGMTEAFFGLLVQAVWTAILTGAFLLLQKRARQNLLIQGG